MKKPSWSVTAAHALICINSVVWLVFALVSGLGWLPGILSTGPIRWVMAILAFGTSCALGILLYLLIRRKRWAYYLVLVLLGMVGILSITDEVGVLDIISLIISLAAFILLVVNRDWYLSAERQ